MVTFCILTVIFLPVMYRYYQGGMFNDLGNFWNTLSLGNLGETGPKCMDQYASVESSVNYKCRKGKMAKL